MSTYFHHIAIFSISSQVCWPTSCLALDGSCRLAAVWPERTGHSWSLVRRLLGTALELRKVTL